MHPIGIGMIIGGLGLDIFGAFQEQEDIEKRAEFQIQQLKQREGLLSTMGAERAHELLVEKEYAVGAARATAAAAGVGVGTGSALTQEKSIAGQYRRKMELIAKKVGFEKSMISQDIQNIESQMKRAKKATWWDLGVDLFSKGFEFASTKGWWGLG